MSTSKTPSSSKASNALKGWMASVSYETTPNENMFIPYELFCLIHDNAICEVFPVVSKDLEHTMRLSFLSLQIEFEGGKEVSTEMFKSFMDPLLNSVC